MNERLKLIMESAIKQEEYSREFYKAAAAKTKVPSAKKLLLRLSAEEQIHKERLETMDFSKLGAKVLADRINEIDVAQELMLTPVNEFKDLKAVLLFAIKKEQAAKKLYEELAYAAEDEKARHLFNVLSSEENNHEAMLAAELHKLSI